MVQICCESEKRGNQSSSSWDLNSLVIGIEADCLTRDLRLQVEWPQWGVFLRDPSPYIREFRRKTRKTPNGKVDKRDRGLNLAPPVFQFRALPLCHWLGKLNKGNVKSYFYLFNYKSQNMQKFCITFIPFLLRPTSGGVLTLKTGRREAPGSNPGRACRTSHSEFSMVFSETRVNTSQDPLERPTRRTFHL